MTASIEQAIGRRLVGDAANVREIGFLRVAQVVEQRAGGRDGRRVAVEPEAFETVRAELIEERAPRGFVLECPRLDARHRQPVAGAVEQHAAQVEIDRRDDLARPQHHHFVGQRLQAGRARRTRRRKTRPSSGRGARPRRRGLTARVWDRASDERQQKRRCALVEMLRVGQRARRHHANDLALDDALGFLRVFDLIADGDAESFLDQPREIGVERRDAERRTSESTCPGRLWSATSASGRGRARRRARPRRTSRRSHPCEKTESRRDTAASRRDTAASPA